MREEEKKKILVRLRRIEGQTRGVQRMIEDEAGCADILNQIAAVKSAINQVSILIFEHYVHDCIGRSLQGSEDSESLDGMMHMLNKLIK